MTADRDIRVLGEAELGELDASLAIAFGEVPGGAEERVRAHLRAQLPNTLGSFQEGRLVSSAGMYPFEMYVGGVRTKVGGLAGVATVPWARRRGHVAALLEAWFTRLHEAGVAWCAEHPFDPGFYARYGFQSLPNGRMLEVPPALFGSGRPPDAERLAGDEADRLKPIHAAYARRYGFALTRDDGARDGWWRVLHPWSGAARHAFLLEDAYAVLAPFRDGSPVLQVIDVAWSSPAGRERLGRFLGAFEGQFGRLRVHLPPGDDQALDQEARHSVETPLVQARIVDLERALAPLRAPAESRWRLAVEDADCSWNAGVFDIRLGPGGSEVTPARGPADAGLDVRALCALLARAAAPEALLAGGRAEGAPEALHALAELMRSQPPFQAGVDAF